MRISKKRRVRGISVYKNKAGGQTELLVKREPDSSQWCPVSGQDGHKLKNRKFCINQETVKKPQTFKVNRTWNRWSSEAVKSLPLEMDNIQLDTALKNL